MLSSGIIIPYDGTHASIPSGFSRVTDLDGMYPKTTANATDPNTTGGAATHTHTSANHSHTLPSHTHGYSLSAVNNVCCKADGYSGLDKHSHTGTTGGSSGGTTANTAATYGAVSNDPPYYTVIFIQATSSNDIPVGGMILSTETSRTSLTFHSASAGKFLKGAGTGANAGGTGGSTTNVHALSHTHTVNTHTHADSTSGGATSAIRNAPNGNSGDRIITNHTHTVSVNAGSQNINTYANNLTTTETVEPAYKTLNAYKNEDSNSIAPIIGDIAMWLGSLASIPSGWVLCDGNNDTPDMRGKYLKCNSTATTSSTGGSNTHTHASQAHTHTSNGTHTHTASNTGNHTGVANNTDNTGGGVGFDTNSTQTHTVTVTGVTTTYSSASTTADSSSNEPAYRTVAYIQFVSSGGGGSFLFNFV